MCQQDPGPVRWSTLASPRAAPCALTGEFIFAEFEGLCGCGSVACHAGQPPSGGDTAEGSAGGAALQRIAKLIALFAAFRRYEKTLRDHGYSDRSPIPCALTFVLDAGQRSEPQRQSGFWSLKSARSRFCSGPRQIGVCRGQRGCRLTGRHALVPRSPERAPGLSLLKASCVAADHRQAARAQGAPLDDGDLCNDGLRSPAADTEAQLKARHLAGRPRSEPLEPRLSALMHSTDSHRVNLYEMVL